VKNGPFRGVAGIIFDTARDYSIADRELSIKRFSSPLRAIHCATNGGVLVLGLTV
jgi:hypothetical protein